MKFLCSRSWITSHRNLGMFPWAACYRGCGPAWRHVKRWWVVSEESRWLLIQAPGVHVSLLQDTVQNRRHTTEKCLCLCCLPPSCIIQLCWGGAGADPGCSSSTCTLRKKWNGPKAWSCSCQLLFLMSSYFPSFRFDRNDSLNTVYCILFLDELWPSGSVGKKGPTKISGSE